MTVIKSEMITIKVAVLEVKAMLVDMKIKMKHGQGVLLTVSKKTERRTNVSKRKGVVMGVDVEEKVGLVMGVNVGERMRVVIRVNVGERVGVVRGVNEMGLVMGVNVEQRVGVLMGVNLEERAWVSAGLSAPTNLAPSYFHRQIEET